MGALREYARSYKVLGLAPFVSYAAGRELLITRNTVTSCSNEALPSFAITDRIPNPLDSTASWLLACAVKSTIAEFGQELDMVRAASRPFFTGIERSSTMRSGFNRSARKIAA